MLLRGIDCWTTAAGRRQHLAAARRDALGAAAIGLLLLLVGPAAAEVRLPSIFGDHMVLQRGQTNAVWGWAEPNQPIQVTFADQTHRVTADEEGSWKVELSSMPAGGPHEIRVEGKSTVTLRDVLVGEVWLCSGQSNMQWSVRQSKDADLEIPAANFPNLRLITIPRVGSQQPMDDFDGEWTECTPQSVSDFSAVGYFFGRQLHKTLGVPVGLIDNAWGGSACEAWVPRDLLAADDRYDPLLSHWAKLEKTYDHEAALAAYEKRLSDWRENGGANRSSPRPRRPSNPLVGQHRPANLYNGVLHPVIGYGIRGAIWYQGESNARRAYQYRHLFPLMVQHWRDAWDQGEFPFYWVQLADFRGESDQPRQSDWAELRESQTMSLSKLPNSGQAVIIDLGEADDIHPVNKQEVARRLARCALAQDYGLSISHESPRYDSFVKKGNKITLRLKGDKNFKLRTFEGAEPAGFAIAGKDRNFVWAQARIIGDQEVEVWSDEVPDPVAVRYAWADNPVCNLQNQVGLPVTPLRTDDWPGVTAGVAAP